MKKNKKEFRWGCFGSLLVHLVIVVFACLFVIQNRGAKPVSTKVSSESAKTKAEVKKEVSKPPIVSSDKLNEYIDKARKRADEMDAGKKLETLKKKSDWMVEKSSLEGIGQAAEFLEKFQGVPKDTRAYEPRDGVKGQFDTESAILYDFEKVEHNGKNVYVRVFVDKDGRVLKESPQSAQPLTDDDKRALKVFKMARENPGLRRLINSVIKMSEKQNKPKAD